MNNQNKMQRMDYQDWLSWEYIWICVDEKGYEIVVV